MLPDRAPCPLPNSIDDLPIPEKSVKKTAKAPRGGGTCPCRDFFASGKANRSGISPIRKLAAEFGGLDREHHGFKRHLGG
jgi:hypothetical protein